MGDVREPGYLEGGDFCPASADLAFVGVGLRSNFEAVLQLMDEDLFGYRRVAVVRDDYEQNQVGAQSASVWKQPPAALLLDLLTQRCKWREHVPRSQPGTAL